MKKIFVPTGFVIALLLSALSVFAQTQSRDDILKEIEDKRAELAALEKRFLSPSENDQAEHADFLRLPETGLIRLLPREKYDTEGSKERKQRLTLRGGGAYYSFTRLTHEYGYGSDIELAQGSLSTGFAGANYGILTSLGDTPLENVTLEIAAAQVLAAHTPPGDEPDARIEQQKWAKGATIEGTSFANRLPLNANTTYLVRAIDYSTSDVLVAFRVVRVDIDGSAIILWKTLKKYPIPNLARN